MTTAKNSGHNDEGARTLLIPIYSWASIISFNFLMWELNDSIINADIIMCTNAISRWWLGVGPVFCCEVNPSIVFHFLCCPSQSIFNFIGLCYFVNVLNFDVGQLEEGNAALQSTREAREKNVPYSCNPAQQEEFFQPLRCDSTLHIW